MKLMIAVLLAIVTCTVAQNGGMSAFLTLRRSSRHNDNVGVFKLTQPNRLAPIMMNGWLAPVIPQDVYVLAVLDEDEHVRDCPHLRPVRLPNANQPFVLLYQIEPNPRRVNRIVRLATLEPNQLRSIRGRAVGLFHPNELFGILPNYNARSVACGWVDNVLADTLPLSTFRADRIRLW